MCVTNTTFRRFQQQPVQLPNLCLPNPELSQRLVATYSSVKQEQEQEQQHQQQLVHVVESKFPFPVGSVPMKSRPKRRRKPQKPGKTAKMNDRHFVVHNYHDHSNDVDNGEEVTEDDDEEHHRRKGGVAVAFPLKLHAILDQVEQDGLAHVISWQPHGRCFVIHQPKMFVETVMPKYFRQTKLTSFQRQLNLYGFCRLTRGNDAGGYYHERFLRGMLFLTKRMIRVKVKGTKFKAASSPDAEPDFYTMPPVTVTPHTSPRNDYSYVLDDLMEAPQMPPTPFMAPGALAAPSPLRDAFSMLQQQPLQFLNNMLEPYPFLAPQPPEQFILQPTFNEPESPAGQTLDEAITEFFLAEGSGSGYMDDGDLDDFVPEWNPAAYTPKLDNDAQLGYLLDRLLDE